MSDGPWGLAKIEAEEWFEAVRAEPTNLELHLMTRGVYACLTAQEIFPYHERPTAPSTTDSAAPRG